jgi:hypothetical protein
MINVKRAMANKKIHIEMGGGDYWQSAEALIVQRAGKSIRTGRGSEEGHRE